MYPNKGKNSNLPSTSTQMTSSNRQRPATSSSNRVFAKPTPLPTQKALQFSTSISPIAASDAMDEDSLDGDDVWGDVDDDFFLKAEEEISNGKPEAETEDMKKAKLLPGGMIEVLRRKAEMYEESQELEKCQNQRAQSVVTYSSSTLHSLSLMDESRKRRNMARSNEELLMEKDGEIANLRRKVEENERLRSTENSQKLMDRQQSKQLEDKAKELRMREAEYTAMRMKYNELSMKYSKRISTTGNSSDTSSSQSQFMPPPPPRAPLLSQQQSQSQQPRTAFPTRASFLKKSNISQSQHQRTEQLSAPTQADVILAEDSDSESSESDNDVIGRSSSSSESEVTSSLSSASADSEDGDLSERESRKVYQPIKDEHDYEFKWKNYCTMDYIATGPGDTFSDDEGDNTKVKEKEEFDPKLLELEAKVNRKKALNRYRRHKDSELSNWDKELNRIHNISQSLVEPKAADEYRKMLEQDVFDDPSGKRSKNDVLKYINVFAEGYVRPLEEELKRTSVVILREVHKRAQHPNNHIFESYRHKFFHRSYQLEPADVAVGILEDFLWEPKPKELIDGTFQPKFFSKMQDFNFIRNIPKQPKEKFHECNHSRIHKLPTAAIESKSYWHVLDALWDDICGHLQSTTHTQEQLAEYLKYLIWLSELWDRVIDEESKFLLVNSIGMHRWRKSLVRWTYLLALVIKFDYCSENYRERVFSWVLKTYNKMVRSGYYDFNNEDMMVLLFKFLYKVLEYETFYTENVVSDICGLIEYGVLNEGFARRLCSDLNGEKCYLMTILQVAKKLVEEKPFGSVYDDLLHLYETFWRRNPDAETYSSKLVYAVLIGINEVDVHLNEPGCEDNWLSEWRQSPWMHPENWENHENVKCKCRRLLSEMISVKFKCRNEEWLRKRNERVHNLLKLETTVDMKDFRILQEAYEKNVIEYEPESRVELESIIKMYENENTQNQPTKFAYRKGPLAPADVKISDLFCEESTDEDEWQNRVSSYLAHGFAEEFVSENSGNISSQKQKEAFLRMKANEFKAWYTTGNKDSKKEKRDELTSEQKGQLEDLKKMVTRYSDEVIVQQSKTLREKYKSSRNEWLTRTSNFIQRKWIYSKVWPTRTLVLDKDSFVSIDRTSQLNSLRRINDVMPQWLRPFLWRNSWNRDFENILEFLRDAWRFANQLSEVIGVESLILLLKQTNHLLPVLLLRKLHLPQYYHDILEDYASLLSSIPSLAVGCKSPFTINNFLDVTESESDSESEGTETLPPKQYKTEELYSEITTKLENYEPNDILKIIKERIVNTKDLSLVRRAEIFLRFIGKPLPIDWNSMIETIQNHYATKEEERHKKWTEFHDTVIQKELETLGNSYVQRGLWDKEKARLLKQADDGIYSLESRLQNSEEEERKEGAVRKRTNAKLKDLNSSGSNIDCDVLGMFENESGEDVAMDGEDSDAESHASGDMIMFYTDSGDEPDEENVVDVDNMEEVLNQDEDVVEIPSARNVVIPPLTFYKPKRNCWKAFTVDYFKKGQVIAKSRHVSACNKCTTTEVLNLDDGNPQQVEAVLTTFEKEVISDVCNEQEFFNPQDTELKKWLDLSKQRGSEKSESSESI